MQAKISVRGGIAASEVINRACQVFNANDSQKELKFKDVYSRDNLPGIKNETSVLNLDGK